MVLVSPCSLPAPTGNAKVCMLVLRTKPFGFLSIQTQTNQGKQWGERNETEGSVRGRRKTQLMSSPSQGPWKTHGKTCWDNRCKYERGKSRLPWTTETGSYEREEDVKRKPDQNENELLFFPNCDELEIKYPRSCV